MTHSPTQDAMGKLLRFLRRLDEDKISYRLERSRDPIMVVVDVPGQRWEVEFYEDGEIEIERFVSTGVVGADEEMLDRLLKEQEDAEKETYRS